MPVEIAPSPPREAEEPLSTKHWRSRKRCPACSRTGGSLSPHEIVVGDMDTRRADHQALLVALVFMAPRYTGEAIIQLDFVRNENVAGEKLQSTAAVDAAAVVDSSARNIRSRGTASAVVSALRLDNDPNYANLSLPAQALSHILS